MAKSNRLTKRKVKLIILLSVFGAILIFLFIAFSYLESGYPFRSLIAKENQDVGYLSDMTLVKEYTFEGDSLNTDEWKVRSNGIRRAGYWDASTVSVHDNKLYFTVKYNETYERYTGTAIGTTATYTYGYFEAKILLPMYNQSWGVFWLSNSNLNTSSDPEDGTEIDVVENLTPFSRFISQTFHYNYQDLHSLRKNSWAPKNIYKNFLTYSVLWTPDIYIIYINGIKYFETSFDGTSQTEEYILLSTEFTDKTISTLDFESEMIVEYVKVYQCSDYSALDY